MPNWCDNTVDLTHSDKSKLDALEAELNKDKEAQLFQHLRPGPEVWEYMWSVENWGTKWDANIVHWERKDDNSINLVFETAWGPPTRLYEYLESEDWQVKAFYYEPGMCFAGIYEDGFDACYEYGSLNAKEIREQLPEELDEMYRISESQEQWEEEMSEESEDESQGYTQDEILQALDELKKEFDKEK